MTDASFFFTEFNDNQSSNGQNIRASFIDREHAQFQRTINDLKASLNIHKEIIKGLVDPTSVDSVSKILLHNALEENEQLNEVIQRVIMERDTAQAELLISQQLIEDYKGKEVEQDRAADEITIDLKDQLERKEYAIQCNEKRISVYENMLKTAAVRDEVLKQKLDRVDLMFEDRRISNVVEENTLLRKEVANLKKELEMLLEEAETLKHTNKLNYTDIGFEDYSTCGNGKGSTMQETPLYKTQGKSIYYNDLDADKSFLSFMNDNPLAEDCYKAKSRPSCTNLKVEIHEIDCGF